jgi:two-component system nitrogen regulation response regulator GlnG
VAVLITGESGTGKELVARALHEHSPRQAKAFVALNTSAIPAELLESELFGHEGIVHRCRQRSGAAVRSGQRRHAVPRRDRRHVDAAANAPAARTAEGEFYRVGGQIPIKVDVRVIAAPTRTGRERASGAGSFREDLYHRLNVIRIELPPLRSRTEDVPDLLALPAPGRGGTGPETKTLAPVTLERLRAYRWPGNVRELVNLAAAHGAGAGQRNPSRGPAVRDAHRDAGRANRLGRGAHALGQGAAV